MLLNKLHTEETISCMRLDHPFLYHQSAVLAFDLLLVIILFLEQLCLTCHTDNIGQIVLKFTLRTQDVGYTSFFNGHGRRPITEGA